MTSLASQIMTEISDCRIHFSFLFHFIGSNRTELAVVLELDRGDLLHAKANQSRDSQADLSD